LAIRIKGVEECDARDDDSDPEVGNIKNKRISNTEVRI
jgi:hypothetical protein